MSNSRYVAKSRLRVSLNTLKLESNENETKLWKFASTMVSRLRDYSNVRFIWGSSAFHSVIQLYIFIKMIITNSKDCFAEKRPSLFQEWTWVLTSQIKIVASPIPRPSLPPLFDCLQEVIKHWTVGRPGNEGSNCNNSALLHWDYETVHWYCNSRYVYDLWHGYYEVLPSLLTIPLTLRSKQLAWHKHSSQVNL